MTIRWGILGTGGVANAFVDALHDVPDAELVAVGSRTFDKVFGFADHHEVDRPHGSYEELVADPDVDVVYVASPASHHYRHTMLALQAGKHVLCEKPFMVNVTQAMQVQSEAISRGLLLMEAMWPRFLPAYGRIRQLVRDGTIGQLLAIHATFGGRASYRPNDRPFRLDLAGGALMDGAVYPINLGQMLCGRSVRVQAVATIGPSDVDEQVALSIEWENGVLMTVMAGITTTFDASAWIYGTEGMLVIPGNFTNPAWIRLDRPGQDPIVFDHLETRHRLSWEIEAFGNDIATGETDDVRMPLGDSFQIAAVMSEARADIGLRFPDDVEAI